MRPTQATNRDSPLRVGPPGKRQAPTIEPADQRAGSCSYFFSFTVVLGCVLPYFGETYRPVTAERYLPPPEDDPFLDATFLTSSRCPFGFSKPRFATVLATHRWRAYDAGERPADGDRRAAYVDSCTRNSYGGGQMPEVDRDDSACSL